jgi:hypothetical protein
MSEPAGSSARFAVVAVGIVVGLMSDCSSDGLLWDGGRSESAVEPA